MVACIVGLSSYNRSVWDASVSRPPGIAPNLQLAAFFFESRCLSLSRAVCASCRRGVVGTWPGALRRASVTIDLRKVRGRHVLMTRMREAAEQRSSASRTHARIAEHPTRARHPPLGTGKRPNAVVVASSDGGRPRRWSRAEAGAGRGWSFVASNPRRPPTVCSVSLLLRGRRRVDDGLGLSVRQAPPPVIRPDCCCSASPSALPSSAPSCTAILIQDHNLGTSTCDAAEKGRPRARRISAVRRANHFPGNPSGFRSASRPSLRDMALDGRERCS